MRIIMYCLLILSFVNISASSQPKILIGSPIKRCKPILKKFLSSLKNIKKEGIKVDYCFIDDNDSTSNYECSQLLDKFNLKCDTNCFIHRAEEGNPYICDENTHHWTPELIWRVAYFKNFIIEEAIKGDYDYLFLVDSDILVHPETLKHLVNTQKDIVSELYWTKRNITSTSEPQVNISGNKKEVEQFYEQLKNPGTYEVDMIGSCILISKKALMSGLNFNQIKNLSIMNDYSHFSIRASSLGFKLHVDTHYPAQHIFRESDLTNAQKTKNPKLTLAMCVKNESERYLKEVLKDAKYYIDEAVIIDDASTDDTYSMCLDLLKGIPVKIIKNTSSKFYNGTELREQLWEELIKTSPEWILFLDADQMFEPKFKNEIQKLISQDEIDVFCFREFDFWQDNYYRSDPYWASHQTYKPFLMRYRKNFDYKWIWHPFHWGRIPYNVMQLPNAISQLRIMHYGYAKQDDRLAKIKRHKDLDPDNKFGITSRLNSILDENPQLYPWFD